MKWFKHMTDANRDEKLRDLREQKGLQWYARYWLILEAIAEQMDERDRCEVKYSDTYWAELLSTKPSHVPDIFLTFVRYKLYIGSTKDGYTTFRNDNLLKIRARKKPIGRTFNALHTDTDTEVHTEPPIVPQKGTTYSSQFLSFWGIYPRKIGKAQAWKIWKRLKLDGKLEEILGAIEKQQGCEQWQDTKFIPHPSTWLNQGRWEDEPEKPKQSEQIRHIANTQDPETSRRWDERYAELEKSRQTKH